jgi:hypothetical protein
MSDKDDTIDFKKDSEYMNMFHLNDGEGIDIDDFQCLCGEGKKGSFLRFYSKGKICCPHCHREYHLEGLTKIQHQR